MNLEEISVTISTTVNDDQLSLRHPPITPSTTTATATPSTASNKETKEQERGLSRGERLSNAGRFFFHLFMLLFTNFVLAVITHKPTTTHGTEN